MRKFRFLGMALLVSVLFVGCGSDIDMVKSGVMQFNKTTTVGEAFDNNKDCKKGEWESFETDNGAKVVQFTCYRKGVKEYFNKVKSFLKKVDDLSPLDVISNTGVYQFTINKDDTFQIDNVQTITKWADNKTTEVPLDAMQALAEIYENKISFNVNELNNLDEMSAVQFYNVFFTLKKQAK